MAISNPSYSFPPFQQGGLDSLCGLYSIVNAERFINHSTDDEVQELFNRIIQKLSRKRLLARFLLDGINHTHMLMILDQVIGTNRIANQRVPWRGVHNPDLDAFWKSMQDFLNGTPGRAIILGLQGYHDHWTVMESITSKSILLYDSASIKRLPRSRCTTVYTTNQRKHLLLPAQTYFLSNGYPKNIRM